MDEIEKEREAWRLKAKEAAEKIVAPGPWTSMPVASSLWIS